METQMLDTKSVNRIMTKTLFRVCESHSGDVMHSWLLVMYPMIESLIMLARLGLELSKSNGFFSQRHVQTQSTINAPMLQLNMES